MRTTGSFASLAAVLAIIAVPAIAAAQSTTLQMPDQAPAAPLAPPQPVQPTPLPAQQNQGQNQLWQPNEQLLQQDAQKWTFQQQWSVSGAGAAGWQGGGTAPTYQTWPQTGWPANPPSSRLGGPTGWPANPPSRQSWPQTGWPNSSWSQSQPGR